MNCRQTRDQLPLFVGGDLSPATGRDVEEHLSGCVSCRLEFERYEDARRSLFKLKGSIRGPTPDLWPSIRRELAGPPRRPPVTVRRLAGAAAALLVAILGGRLLIPGPPVDSTPPREVAATGLAISRMVSAPAPPAFAFPLEEATIGGDGAVYESAPALTTLDPERSEWDEF